MADTSINGSDSAAKIEFVQFHRPGLPPGDYIITVTQEVAIPGVQQTPFSTQRRFAVYGDRFALKPQDIQAVFPPDSSLGEHSNVLPHIVFNRSTLPWERSADAHKEDVPWLALLLFEDAEKPMPPKTDTTTQLAFQSTVKLSDLENPSGFPAKFPALHLQSGQKADDLVTVIDVKKRLLQTILPSADALTLLAHVRVGLNADGSQNELAVIIGNRLPVRGATSTVHLVSVEGRYTNGSFDYQGAGDEDLIRLVSLKSWSFACVDEKQSFKGLLMHLDHNPSTLRLPKNANPQAEKYLAMGHVLLPHTLRETGKTASWYHGPLVTATNMVELTLPVQAADKLVRYNPATGLFDISYAAAWELGRLLALQSKQLSTNLYLWKRTHAQLLRQAEQQLLHAYLPIQVQPVDPGELFKAITAWFTNLGLLQGVPFNYLVPDERMLPKESIRFFWLDRLWVDCLLDGAFSIGRVTTSDYALDQSHATGNSSPATNLFNGVTGFLLRSDVVAGWPGLQATGYDSNRKELPLPRIDRLSPNVLICLFDGEVNSVALHQKPETLHFGLDFQLDENGHIPPAPAFYKILRDSLGDERPDLKIPSIPWQQEAQRIIDIFTLAGNIQQKTNTTPFTAAQFAFQMIEGVEEVIFQKK